MEAVEVAARELSNQLQFLASAIDSRTDHQTLKFTLEEEQAVEDRLNDAVDVYRMALQDAQEWLLDADLQAAAAGTEALTTHQDGLKKQMARVRKTLISYRQRAKLERHHHARSSVMQKSNSSSDGKKMSSTSGSAVDYLASMKRTQRVMLQEIDRVGNVTKVLDDGRLSLQSSHQEFGSATADIAEVRKHLKALKWQARQDRLWIAAGIALLASTVLFIVYERTGLIII